MSMSISITIIGHNEAYHLEDLLPQLKWADEIIYVDCESKDHSLQLAKEKGCKTFSRPNNPNLNINKSFAFEQACGEWIFYLDPDERIPQSLSYEILTTVNSNPEEVAFRLRRRNHYFGHWLKHGSQYPDVQLRLFRKGFAKFPLQHVHEKLQINGGIGMLQNDMLHYPYLNISQYLQKFDFYTSFEARFLYKNHVPVSGLNHFRYFFSIPLTRFMRRYILKRGFLDGMPGLFAASFDALNYTVRYFKLWELYRENVEE